MNGDKNMSVGDGTVMVEDKIVFIRRESFSFPVLASHGEATRKSPVSLACSTPLLTRGVTPTITF